jgi:asparagine synthase (glutamine-hydrolysing)
VFLRGPDAVGQWVSRDRRWFLGHTRLSIIGLSNGEQPIADATGAVTVFRCSIKWATFKK